MSLTIAFYRMLWPNLFKCRLYMLDIRLCSLKHVVLREVIVARNRVQNCIHIIGTHRIT